MGAMDPAGFVRDMKPGVTEIVDAKPSTANLVILSSCGGYSLARPNASILNSSSRVRAAVAHPATVDPMGASRWHSSCLTRPHHRRRGVHRVRKLSKH